MIPLSAPDINDDDIASVVEVLRTERLSLGPQLIAFERAFAEYIGVPHAIAVNSGTSGLHLAVRALGLGPGDEVIVPSFTFIAAANAIRYEGATPVFVDIDTETLNLSPIAVEQAITPRTRAILVVHTFGVPADMDALEAIAARHDLTLLEDACEAIGATLRGRSVGSFGAAAVFAFYPNKQMTTGEGGMIITHDAALAQRMRAMRNHGRYDTADLFQHAELGYNYRLSEINCALGLSQLRRLPAMLRQREAIARMYHARLAGGPLLILPPLAVTDASISWFVYVVRLRSHIAAPVRERILEYLQAQGVGCARYFVPIHKQPAYAAWRDAAQLPVTDSVAERVLALPFFNRLTQALIDEVCGALEQALWRFAADA